MLKNALLLSAIGGSRLGLLCSDALYAELFMTLYIVTTIRLLKNSFSVIPEVFIGNPVLLKSKTYGCPIGAFGHDIS